MLLGFFLKGLAIGGVIALPVGPVGIICVRRTIFEGRLAGLVSGLGAAVGDAFIGSVAAFGLTFVANSLLGYATSLTAGAACFLMVLGLRALFARPSTALTGPPDPESLFGDFLSTFVLTLANPVTMLSVFGIFAAIGLGAAHATVGDGTMLVFGVFTGSLLWWLALSFGVARFFSALQSRDLAWINRCSGGILLLSGMGLLIALARRHIG
jgi:threonine/homoserine/homoserine lactone efflux protein